MTSFLLWKERGGTLSAGVGGEGETAGEGPRREWARRRHTRVFGTCSASWQSPGGGGRLCCAGQLLALAPKIGGAEGMGLDHAARGGLTAMKTGEPRIEV